MLKAVLHLALLCLLAVTPLAVACTAARSTTPGAPAHCASLEQMRAAGPVELDAVPKPIGATTFDFPEHLLREPVRGTATVDVRLNEEGRVLRATVVQSELPREFDPFLSRSIEAWRFTPPTVNGGCPVKIQAVLPIPVDTR